MELYDKIKHIVNIIYERRLITGTFSHALQLLAVLTMFAPPLLRLPFR